MTNDLISREAAIKMIRENGLRGEGYSREEREDNLVDMLECLPAVDAAPVDGNTSDGYHTFNELYHHRAVLFSVIVKAFPDKAWKARKHHDGSMYDGMFIVGIETPDGQATYHYDIDPYWNMFDCREMEFAPEWDGHTAAQAIDRMGELEPVVHGRWIIQDSTYTKYQCSACKERNFDGVGRYCPNCGARMDEEAVNAQE